MLKRFLLAGAVTFMFAVPVHAASTLTVQLGPNDLFIGQQCAYLWSANEVTWYGFRAATMNSGGGQAGDAAVYSAWVSYLLSAQLSGRIFNPVVSAVPDPICNSQVVVQLF
jgi:hypothetical protein